MTGYRLTPYNQIDDYGQGKTWKMEKQALAFRKRKSQIASAVEVHKFCWKAFFFLYFFWLILFNSLFIYFCIECTGSSRF